MPEKWWAARIIKRFRGSGYTLTVLKGSDSPPVRNIAYGACVTIGEKYLQENYPIAYAGFLTQLMAIGTHKWHNEGKVRCNVWDDPIIVARDAAIELTTKERVRRVNELIQATGRVMRGPKKG